MNDHPTSSESLSGNENLLESELYDSLHIAMAQLRCVEFGLAKEAAGAYAEEHHGTSNWALEDDRLHLHSWEHNPKIQSLNGGWQKP